MRFLFLSVMILMSLGQARSQDSNPEILHGYVSALRLDTLDELQRCRLPTCDVFRALNTLLSAEDIADLGVALAFSRKTWSFDSAAVGTKTGGGDAQLFVSEPIQTWGGDLLVMTSSTSPQRVSIARIANLRIGFKPKVTVLYDTVNRTELLGKGAIPLGTVQSVTVLGSRKLLLVGKDLGSRAAERTERFVLMTITLAGVQLTE